MSKGTWKEREDGPPEAVSRRPLRDALEIRALEVLNWAIAFEELAARARTDAVKLGRLATQYGGLPPMQLVADPEQEEQVAPLLEQEHDSAA